MRVFALLLATAVSARHLKSTDVFTSTSSSSSLGNSSVNSSDLVFPPISDITSYESWLDDSARFTETDYVPVEVLTVEVSENEASEIIVIRVQHDG